jgi:enediyne biosynthesis protein E4
MPNWTACPVPIINLSKIARFPAMGAMARGESTCVVISRFPSPATDLPGGGPVADEGRRPRHSPPTAAVPPLWPCWSRRTRADERPEVSPSPEVPSDDGSAPTTASLRRWLAWLTLAGLTGVVLIVLLIRPDGGEQAGAAPTSRGAITAPHIPFTDVTRASGIAFRHENGARGEKLLPETMGGGVVVFDFDGDGRPDILFVNSSWWPDDPRWADPSKPRPVSALYHNETPPGGSIRFRDVTVGSGLETPMYGMGAAAGDFDNDGRVDLFFTGVGGNRLFRNVGGGRFEDVTVAAGVGGDAAQWTTAAAWIDIDNDGDLDLLVTQYVTWSPELDRKVNSQLAGIGKAYGRPWNFPGASPRLYRNDGGSPGRVQFTDITASSGLAVTNKATGLALAKSLAVAPIDLNHDGWIDLVVANDTVQNFVFTNRGGISFAEVGVESGVAFDPYGSARGAMGIDAARFRNDEATAIAIGNFANEMNALYVAQRPREQLLFADAAASSGIGPASQRLLKFGLFFFDADLDGRLDLLTCNGHIEADIEKVQPGVKYKQPAQLFWNAGGAPDFSAVGPETTGPDLFQPIAGRGSAYGDFDGDGDLDVVLAQVNGPPVVLRNDQNLGRHWMRLKLVGRRSNRDAIGAWVYARVGARLLARQVMPTRSYLSQSELPVTLGLGADRVVESLEIEWPGGQRQQVRPPACDTATTIVEETR